MERDGFVFYGSFYEAVCSLPEEYQLSALKGIIEYGLHGTMTDDGISRSILLMAKPQIDKNNERYIRGKTGGRPNQTKTKPEPNNNQTVTKPKPNDNQTRTKAEPKDKDKVKVKEKEINKEKENPVLEAAMSDFIEFRKRSKAPMTDRAIELAWATLERLAPGDTETKVAIINQSIVNGWKGLYALKDDYKTKTTSFGIEREEDLDAMLLKRVIGA